jgi:hypothetical protein
MKLIVIGLAVVVLLFAVAIGVAARNDDRSTGNPSASRLAFLEDLFPPRTLSAADAEKAGAGCLRDDGFVVVGSCAFTVPDGVRRVALRRINGSPPLTVTLKPPSGRLVQEFNTAKAGPNKDDPDAYRLAVVDDGSELQMVCGAVGPCPIALDRT